MEVLHHNLTKRKVSAKRMPSIKLGLCAIVLALSLVPAEAFAALKEVSSTADDSSAGTLRTALTGFDPAVDTINIKDTGTSKTISLTSDLIEPGTATHPINYADSSESYVRIVTGANKFRAGAIGDVAGTGDLLLGRLGAYNSGASGRVHIFTGLSASSVADLKILGGGLALFGSADLAGTYENNVLRSDGSAVTSANAARSYGGGVFFQGVSAPGATPPLTSSVNGAIIRKNISHSIGSASSGAESAGGGIYTDRLLRSFSATVDSNIARSSLPGSGGTGVEMSARGGGAFINGGSSTVQGTFTNNLAEARVTAGSTSGSKAVALAEGGGLFLNLGSSDFSAITVTGNSAVAVANDDKSDAHGGGILINSDISQVITFSSASITNNSANASSASSSEVATAEGGGLHSKNPRVLFGTASQAAGTLAATISNNSVTASNTAGSATALGGGLYLSHGLVAANNNVIVLSNNSASATAGAGTATATGGGLYIPGTGAINTIKGIISGNSVSATATSSANAIASEGALSVEASKDLRNISIKHNKARAVAADGSASAHSGAFSFIKGTNAFSGDLIANSVSASNSFSPATAPTVKQKVVAIGGAIYSKGVATTSIEGGTITDNTVTATANPLGTDIIAGGGAIFYETDSGPINSGINLIASDGNIRFANNSVTVNGHTRKNDITFGQSAGGVSTATGPINFNIYGSPRSAAAPNSSVSLESGFEVNINSSQKFLFNREIRRFDRANVFFWGGDNRIASTGANNESTISLKSGKTVLSNDFRLYTPDSRVAGEQTTALHLFFGAEHELALDLHSRRGFTPLFNLRNAATSTLTVEEGSSIIAPTESNRASGGKHLLIDGITDHSSQSDNFVLAKNNTNFRAQLIKLPGQLWIDYLWIPSGIDFTPNTERAFDSGALTQMLSGTDASIALTDEQSDALIRDANSITPEAAVTAGIIGERVHIAAANQAVRQNRFAFANKAQNQASLLSAESLAFNLEAKRQKAAAAPLAQTFDSANKIINNSNSARFMQALSLNLDAYGQKISNQNDLQQMYLDGGSVSNGVSIWSSFFGNYSDLKNSKGYHGYEVDSNGFLLGASYKASPIWGLGLYGGYSHSDYDFKRIHAEGDANTFHAGIVSKLDYDDFYLSTDFAYSLSKNKLRRDPGKLAKTKGEFDQDTYSLGFELAYDIRYAETGKVSPFLGGRQKWLKQESFSEKGGTVPSRVGKVDDSSFVSDLGIRVEHAFVLDNGTVLQPNASVAWQHRFSDNRLSASTHFLGLSSNDAPISYKVKSNKFGQDAVTAGLGLNTEFGLDNSQSINLSLGYDIAAEEKNTEHNVYGGVKFSF